MNHREAWSLPVVGSLTDTAYSGINGIPKVWIQMRRKDFHLQMEFGSLPVVPELVSWFSVSISGCALSAYEEGPDFLDLMQSCWIIGAEGQNRTADTRLFRPLLYRLSYLGPGCHYKEKRASCQGSVFPLATLWGGSWRSHGFFMEYAVHGRSLIFFSSIVLGTRNFHVIVQRIFSCIQKEGPFCPESSCPGSPLP